MRKPQRNESVKGLYLEPSVLQSTYAQVVEDLSSLGLDLGGLSLAKNLPQDDATEKLGRRRPT